MAVNWTDDLIIPEIIEPGPVTRAWLEPQMKRRYASVDRLKKIDDKCAWCNLVPVLDKRRKYCSEKCSDSKNFWIQPQSPGTKGLLLHRQQWACAGCGESYEDHFKAVMEKKINRKRYAEIDASVYDKITLYYLMHCTGDILHVDHILSIHHGGDGIGLHNVQVLCVKCHHAKSGYDRSPLR